MIDTFQLTTLLGLGFILGLKHTFDPDHIIAVSTIVSQAKNIKRSLLQGLLWGLGHTATLFLVGSLILIFKISIPPKMTLVFELLVGAVLIILGINVLARLFRVRIHLHKHKHDKVTHAHLHSHEKPSSHEEPASHAHSHRSFMVGMLHGLAGSAALMLIVLASVGSISHGLFYVGAFGAGLTIGMLIVSGIISLPFIFTERFDRFNLVLKIITGLVSISLGALIVFRIIFTSGLFF